MKNVMKGIRRRLAAVLVVCMVFTLLPVNAAGAEVERKRILELLEVMEDSPGTIPFDDEIVDEDAMFYSLEDEEEATPSDTATPSDPATPSNLAMSSDPATPSEADQRFEELCQWVDTMPYAKDISLPLSDMMKLRIYFMFDMFAVILEQDYSYEGGDKDLALALGPDRIFKMKELLDLFLEDPQPEPGIPEEGSDVSGGLDLSGELPGQDISWRAGEGTITYLADTNTLILDNAAIVSGEKTGLELPGTGIQIVLVGSSTISGQEYGVRGAGAWEEDLVTIRGDGILNVRGGDNEEQSVGIGGGWFQILGEAVVHASGGSADTSAGIMVFSLELDERADVTATGGKAETQSMGVMGNVAVSGDAMLTAKGSEAGAYSMGIIINGSVTVNGGTLTADGGNAEYESAGVEADLIEVSGGGTINAAGYPGAENSCGIYLVEEMAVRDGIVCTDGATAAVYMESRDTCVTVDGGILKSTKAGVWEDFDGRIVKTTGILLDGSSFWVFSDTGRFELHHDLVIPEGCDAEIPDGMILTVANDTTLTNDGTLANRGIIGGPGSITGHGMFKNAGKVILSEHMIEAPENLTYDGSGKTIQISLLGLAFEEDTDYTAVYTPNNVEVGTFSATVTPLEGGGLTGGPVTVGYKITSGQGGNPPVTPDPPATKPDSDSSDGDTDSSGPAAMPEPVYTTTQTGIQIISSADETGAVSVEIPEAFAEEAVRLAQAAAAEGPEGTGLTVSIDIRVRPGQAAGVMSVTLSEEAVQTLIGSGVSALRIHGLAGTASLDMAAIIAMQAESRGALVIRVQRLEPWELPEELKGIVGRRPAFRYTVTNGDRDITDLQGGVLSVSIPYMPEAGENAGGVHAYQIDGDGKVHRIAGSAYDLEGKTVNAQTGHLSIIAVGAGTER